MYNIGSVVQFDGNEVRVFVDSDATDHHTQLHGAITMICAYTLRLCRTVRVDRSAQVALTSALHSPSDLNATIEELLRGYQQFYNLDELRLAYGGITPKAKRSVEYMMQYTDSGFMGRLSPRGFGIFGKNIEITSVTACLLTVQYMREKYGTDHASVNAIDNSLRQIAEYIDNTLISNEIHEVQITQEVLRKVFDQRQ